MRASPGLFIRVSLSKDKVPEPNHYFIYYTCEVRVKRKRSSPRLFRQQRHASLMPLSLQAELHQTDAAEGVWVEPVLAKA